MPGLRAGSGVGKYNAYSLKQPRKRFNFITKKIHFAHLGILFIYDRNVLYGWCERCRTNFPTEYNKVVG